jgi:creatinine amidohydrolase
MRFEDLNWMDVERYLEHDDRVMLVTGTTRQHAYLSLLTDVLIPSKLALAVSQQEHVLIAPPIPFGSGSYQFAGYPGTINISTDVFHMLLTEIIESLMHQGFMRFFVFNGHSGNELPPRLQDFQLDGLIRVVWYDWWNGNAVRSFEERHSLRLEHANWGENFAFTRVADVPGGEKPLVNPEEIEEDVENLRELLGDGSYGGPYQVDDALMQELFADLIVEATAVVRGNSPE